MNGAVPDPRSLGNGIHLIPAPLPFRSPAWVNCYALETPHGIVLIDCGCDWEPGREALTSGLESVGLADAPIVTLIVSHLHPDHVGMARRVTREHEADFLMHRRAADLVDRYNDTPGFVERNLALSARHGVPASAARELSDVGPRPDYMPLIDPPNVVVEDGDTIPLGDGRYLEVLHTPGHDPSHICLRDLRTGITFSGDHVLPRISPVIMFDEDYEDVLGDYIRSLNYLLEIPIGVTYPAHGDLIDRGSARVEQILLHHERRLGQMTERAYEAAQTAWEMMNAIFRPNLTTVEQRLALRETVAHLEHLRLRSVLTTQEREGTLLYGR